MIGAQITGLGTAIPRGILSNAELADRYDVSEEWIVARTGIETRRIAGPDETTSGLGTLASLQALAAADVAPEDIDLIICATVTPDWRFPSVACVIQNAIGSRAGAFDLNAACSGFLFALAQADASVRSGAARRVLVVGCDVVSRITDYEDPKSAVLFGDGAGAVVVERCEDGARLGPFSLLADGARPRLLYVPEDTGLIHMEGREVYRSAVAGMSSSVADLLGSCGIDVSEVDLLIGHQANRRILDAVAARLGLDDSQVFSNIARYGNTSSASIPLALSEAQETGLLKDGDLLMLTAFGAGFAWGAGLVRWGTGALEAPTLVTAGDVNV